VVFNALDRGIDLRLLASSSVNRPGDKAAVFMVRQDLIDSGKYRDPKDLKGWNVAQVGVYSTFFIDKVLAKGGLTLDDVKLTQLPAPDIMTAFSNKGMDAGWVTEPYASNIAKQGWGKAVYSTGEIAPGQVAAELIMSPQLGKDQPDAIKRFVTAFVHGARDYYHAINKGDTDKGPIIDALANHTAIKDKALYSQIGLPSISPNADVDPTPSWNEVQDFYMRRGIQKTKIELSKYIDGSFVSAALASLGREQD
jgi:NitT/TauT family transport system substrate-binding protein